MENLKETFLERVYPLELVTENLAKGTALKRENFLKPNYGHNAFMALRVANMGV